MISIIILNWNTLDYLKRCIEAIKRNTKEKYELIIVDNGSKEKGTKRYIDSIADKLIFNPKNLGISVGYNQGASIASGKYLIFMNSDTEVEKDWLTNMLSTLSKNKNIGAVGPIGNPKYREANGIIWSYQQYEGQYSEDTRVNFLSGYCILVKREAYEKVGGFDEIFDKGLFEDNLFCRKLINKGYELWVCSSSIVWHMAPSQSFIANKINYDKLYVKNEKIFEEAINGEH